MQDLHEVEGHTGYRDYARYIADRRRTTLIQQHYRTSYVNWIAGAAKSNPKTSYDYVQPDSAL